MTNYKYKGNVYGQWVLFIEKWIKLKCVRRTPSTNTNTSLDRQKEECEPCIR